MDFFTFCAVLAGYLALIVAAGILADYVAPHIKPLERFIDGLPLAQDNRHTETQEKPTEGKETGRKAA